MNCKEYSGQLNAKGLKFGIVVSRFNDLFTGQLLKGALDCLARHGADEKNVDIVWVPGAYEQPIALKRLALAKKHGAIGVDTQAAFDRVLKHQHSSNLSWDRVHPNSIGHMVIARAFLDAVGFVWSPVRREKA